MDLISFAAGFSLGFILFWVGYYFGYKDAMEYASKRLDELHR